jgi:hypothetical protein
MGNWPTLDDDRGGRRQIAFGVRPVCVAAHLSRPRGDARMTRFGADEPRAPDRTGLRIDNHATVPSVIALPFERPLAIGRPVRGLRRARKSRGKSLTRGAPEDAQIACPVASICSMTRSTRAR